MNSVVAVPNQKVITRGVLMILLLQFITFTQARNANELVTSHGSYHLVAVDYYESFLFGSSFKLRVSHLWRGKLAFFTEPLHGCKSYCFIWCRWDLVFLFENFQVQVCLAPCFSACSPHSCFHYSRKPPSNIEIINTRRCYAVTHLSQCNAWCFIFVARFIRVFQKAWEP